MKKYSDFTREELKAEYEALLAKYNEYKAEGLKLDLSRGKPNAEQLDLTLPILSELKDKSACFSESGFDCRNFRT